MGTGAHSLGVKRTGRETDHSPPSSAEVKGCVELYLHSPNTPSWRGATLKNSTGVTLLTFTNSDSGGNNVCWCKRVTCSFPFPSISTEISIRFL
jgi:hypothetical protein